MDVGLLLRWFGFTASGSRDGTRPATRAMVFLGPPPRAQSSVCASRSPIAPRAVLAAAVLAASACSTTIQGGAAADAPVIEGVSIAGNRAVGDDDIVDGLANRPPEGIFRRVYRRLDRLALEQDIARIQSYYQRRGFFSAKVVGTDIVPTGDHAVKVTFRVVEGPPTRIAGLTIAGLSPTLQSYGSISRERRPLRTGQVFRHDQYLDFKSWLQNWMAYRGYPHAEVKGEVDIDRDRHEADVRLMVDAGPPAVFGKTEIGGLKKVPESVVRNRVAWQPGERFKLANLQLTQARLYQLGLFSAVRMDFEKEGRPRVTDVRIHLTEAKRHELRLGGGVKVDGGFELGSMRIEVRQRTDYVMRRAITPLSTFHVDARPAYVWNFRDEQSGLGGEATATLDRADLFVPRVIGKVTVGYERDELEAYTNEGPLFRLDLARPFFHDRLQVSVGWRLRALDISDVDPALDGVTPPQMDNPVQTPDPAEEATRAAIGLDRAAGSYNYRVGALEQTVTFDQRDSPLDARRGVYASVTVAEAGAAVGSDFPFVRLTGDLRGYLPIGDRLVLAARAFYGRGLGDNILPATERFFDGGASGHRGFAFRRLTPFVSSTYTPFDPDAPSDQPPQPVTDEAPVGGDEDFLTSGEVRVDMGKLKGFPFGVVGFVDGGDVVCRPELTTCLPGGGLDLSHLHWAVGTGVRWNPIISVRLDVGYRLNRYQDDEPDAGTGFSRFAFHISLGQAF